MEWLIPVVIIVVVALVVGLVLWASYRSLITLNLRVDEAWSELVEQMRHRAELIPSLVSTIEGVAGHEKAVLQKVAQARDETLAAGTPAEASVAENDMQRALKSIFAVAEGYPQLQSSKHFLALQADIVDSEDKIQTSRRFYNGGVRELNTKVSAFPNSLLVRGSGVGPRDFFEVGESAAIAEPPRVQF